MSNKLIKLLHIASQFVIFSFNKLVLARKFKVDHQLGDSEPTIFAANHQHRLDPYVLIASISYKDFFSKAPFCFMTANKYFEPLWMRLPMWLSGCFPTHHFKDYRYGIPGAIDYLKDGYSLVMFPEGRMVRDLSSRPETKSGIYHINQSVPEAQIVLMKIDWKNKRIKSRPNQISLQKDRLNDLMDDIYQL